MSDSLEQNEAVDDEGVLDVNEVEESIAFAYSITSFGADFLVDGLVQRLNDGDIRIPSFDPPEIDPSTDSIRFQRKFTWTKTQMDRFIESLLLGFPVPGLFLVQESDGVLLVLDGQQRLSTLRDFIGGITRGREYKLEKVQAQFAGKTYKQLDDESRRRLRNSVIHATVVRQDEPTGDQSSVYMIFERLNTGGTILQPQEVRVALYHGLFAELLKELNNNDAWRRLYGKTSPKLKDHEMILRFFAFLYDRSSYRRPLKEFLNNYMSSNRNLRRQSRDELAGAFTRTVNAIDEAVGVGAFRFASAAVNAALLESVMVGVSERLQSSSLPKETLKLAYDQLLANDAFTEVIRRSTADEDRVEKRLALAVEAFDTA